MQFEIHQNPFLRIKYFLLSNLNLSHQGQEGSEIQHLEKHTLLQPFKPTKSSILRIYKSKNKVLNVRLLWLKLYLKISCQNDKN